MNRDQIFLFPFFFFSPLSPRGQVLIYGGEQDCQERLPPPPSTTPAVFSRRMDPDFSPFPPPPFPSVPRRRHHTRGAVRCQSCKACAMWAPALLCPIHAFFLFSFLFPPSFSPCPRAREPEPGRGQTEQGDVSKERSLDFFPFPFPSRPDHDPSDWDRRTPPHASWQETAAPFFSFFLPLTICTRSSARTAGHDDLPRRSCMTSGYGPLFSSFFFFPPFSLPHTTPATWALPAWFAHPLMRLIEGAERARHGRPSFFFFSLFLPPSLSTCEPPGRTAAISQVGQKNGPDNCPPPLTEQLFFFFPPLSPLPPPPSRSCSTARSSASPAIFPLFSPLSSPLSLFVRVLDHKATV